MTRQRNKLSGSDLLKALRSMIGLSQAELGKRTYTDRSMVYRVEKGIQPFTVEFLKSAIDALGGKSLLQTLKAEIEKVEVMLDFDFIKLA